MKIMLIAMLSLIHFDDLNKIAMVNRLKKEAEIAYNENKFGEAAEKYRILVDSLGLDDEKILLNLSHCYFNLKDTTSAYSHYRSLAASTNSALRSVAQQQLGILNTISGRYDEAEENFREALRANPGNEDARYNYELLRKRMREQQSQNQQQNQENKEQQENKKQQDQQNKGDDQQSQDQQKNEDQGQNEENKEGKKNIN